MKNCDSFDKMSRSASSFALLIAVPKSTPQSYSTISAFPLLPSPTGHCLQLLAEAYTPPPSFLPLLETTSSKLSDPRPSSSATKNAPSALTTLKPDQSPVPTIRNLDTLRRFALLLRPQFVVSATSGVEATSPINIPVILTTTIEADLAIRVLSSAPYATLLIMPLTSLNALLNYLLGKLTTAFPPILTL